VARAGRKSQRFEVRPGDCWRNDGWDDCANNRERSEFSIKKRWRYGKTMWIGFSVYLPADFQTSSRVRTTIGQIHQEGGPSGTAGGLASFPPMMQLEAIGNSYKAGFHLLSGAASNVRDDVKYFDLARISDMRGRWTDVLIHFDTSGGRELAEVYVNGQRRAQIAGFIRFRPQEYYFKYGIYRSFVSRHGGPMPTQVVYIDEVRMGKTRAKAELNPSRPVD
jgi:hypothetical protein